MSQNQITAAMAVLFTVLAFASALDREWLGAGGGLAVALLETVILYRGTKRGAARGS